MGQIKVEKNVGGIEGLCVIEPAVHGDARGYFMETYNEKDMKEAGIDIHFVQDKSSAMFTFINAVFNEEVRKNSTVFTQCENVKNTIFSEPIVIDPSAFDNVHNVLDIIIASLYRKFSDKYDVSSEQFDNYRREKLLNEFQKVYKDREKGNEIAEFKVTKEYIKLVRAMQDKMISELVCRGIGIETNPSSNYLIGTIKKYEEHPILRFNSRKLKETNTGENICVSINTDDQGVFDTLLENEYALMTLALKKATDADMNVLYDIEDIYEWIDDVRKMGLDQVFS